MCKTVHITHGKYIHVFAIIGAANWKVKNLTKEMQPTVSNTSPIRLNIAHSIGWSGAEKTSFQGGGQIKI